MSKNLMAFHDKEGFKEAVDYCVDRMLVELARSEVEKNEGSFEDRMKHIAEVVDQADYLRRIIERYKDLRIKTLEDMLSEEIPV